MGIEGFDKNCNSLSASFKYDALGRRIEKTINGRMIQYLYDGLDIVQEIEDGMVTVNYIRTLNIDEPLARIESDGTVRYYHADALGSVIALTDDLGNVRTQYNYSPFGETELIGESSDNPFQYTGRKNDGTGLYYYRARYYSSYLKRFISEDPIGLLGGDVNYYVYVWNAPVNLVDPWGLVTIYPEYRYPFPTCPSGVNCVNPGFMHPPWDNPWEHQFNFPFSIDESPVRFTMPFQIPIEPWFFYPPPPSYFWKKPYEVGPPHPSTEGCHPNK